MLNGIELVHVVAMDKNNCIGKGNDLPWRLPEDLKHFKEITKGGIIVMGRKTFDSLPGFLPNRTHYVLSKSPQQFPASVRADHDLDLLLLRATDEAKHLELKSIFIIGGGELYSLTMKLVDRIEMTNVEIEVENGDTFYPKYPEGWREFDEIPWNRDMENRQTDTSSGIVFGFNTWWTPNE